MFMNEYTLAAQLQHSDLSAHVISTIRLTLSLVLPLYWELHFLFSAVIQVVELHLLVANLKDIRGNCFCSKAGGKPVKEIDLKLWCFSL